MSVISEKSYYHFDGNNHNKNEKVMRFELKEAMEVIIRHGKNDDRSNCTILNSYPLSMTIIRYCSNNEKTNIIRKLNEFSRVVKGSHWIVLEEVNDDDDDGEYKEISGLVRKKKEVRSRDNGTKNITMLEFFNYNEGLFRNNTAGIVDNIDEMNIMYNYFSHPNSILGMNIENKSNNGVFVDEDDSDINSNSNNANSDLFNTGRSKTSMATTLRRRRDFETGNSRSFFGITFSNPNNGLEMNSYKLKELDESCLAFMVKISNIESLDVSLNDLESIYNEFWFISENKSSKRVDINSNNSSCTDSINSYVEISNNSNNIKNSSSKDIENSLSHSGSFLTILAFKIEKNEDAEDSGDSSSEYNNRVMDMYMLHIFENNKEYEFISKSETWNDYLLSLMKMTKTDARNSGGILHKNRMEIEFSIHRLIYCCNSYEYKFSNTEEEGLLANKEKNGCIKLNIQEKASKVTGAVLVKSGMKKNDSCLKQVLCSSNVSSSTDLDSVTTSINSSRENLTMTDSSSVKKKSMEVIMDDSNSDLSFREKYVNSESDNNDNNVETINSDNNVKNRLRKNRNNELLNVESRVANAVFDSSNIERGNTLLGSVLKQELDSGILVSSLDNIDFWKSSLRTNCDFGIFGNTDCENLSSYISNTDSGNANDVCINSNVSTSTASSTGNISVNNKSSNIELTREEDEYYECRDMKYEPYELKRILTQMSLGRNARCSFKDCAYCNNLSSRECNKDIQDDNLWCKSGFKSFCQVYKRMGVVRLIEKTSELSGSDFGENVKNSNNISWLIREFIGDEISDMIFCNGKNRRRTIIEGNSKVLRVYLVGDFNNWNKTSHELSIETEDIEFKNKDKYVGYPEIPKFMKGRVYSIILRNEDLTNSGCGLSSFKLRIVTTRRKELESHEEVEESETYRLLTYSRNLTQSDIRDNGNNKLLDCLLDINEVGNDKINSSRLRYPLPMCVDIKGMTNWKSDKLTKNDSIFILDKIIRNTRLSSLYVYESNISCSNGLRADSKNRSTNSSYDNSNLTQDLSDEFGTFFNFKKNVLPRVSRGGYNTILFSDVLEHSRNYDYQYPCNYFVPHTEYGSLKEFKELVDECHKRGLLVLIDFNLTFGDIISSNSMLQPCDREVNNNLGSNAREVGEVINDGETNENKRIEDINDDVCSSNETNSFGVNNTSSRGIESDIKSGIENLFVDDSVLDLYESFMLTNINTINPSFFKHTPEVISSLFTFNKNYSRLNLCYIPMLSIVISSIYYLMTELGIDGFRFTLPDLFEEGDKYPLLASILALINDVVHSIKPYGITIANELLLRENMQERACSELSIPIEHGGIGFDFIWDVSICSSLQDIAIKNISYSLNNNIDGGLNIGRDIIESLIPFEDRMKLSGRRVLLLSKKKRKDRITARITDSKANSLGFDGGDEDTAKNIGSDQDVEERRKGAVELVCRTIRGIESLETKTITQNPLRIAMFSWESLHTHLVGGVSPHVSELSASLVRLGHEVHLFTRATGSSYIIKEHDGVLYHECPFQLNSDFVTEITNMCNSFVYHMQRWEDGLTKMSDHFIPNPQGKNNGTINMIKNGYRFNICHCHDWLAAPVLTSLRRIGNNNRTTIFTVHSTEYGRCGNQSFGGQSRRISDIEREGCHTADRLICVSGVLAEEVCRLFGVNRDKIKVIYNGIHCHAFDRVVMDDPGEIKRQFGIGPLEPTFLCVARMVIQKGVDLLVEAVPGILKYRNDAKFILVGDGHQKDEIEKRAHQLGVYNSIRFVGKKSGDDVVRLYKACDAVVVPSRNEPFGIVVLEGWTAGKPVVATTSGGPRDFLTPNVDGYLVEPCKDSIAWGCCEILKNFDHSRWMGSRGRVKAAYSFSWDTIARTTSYLYYEQTNTLDSAPSLVLKPNVPVMLQIFGENALHHHMTVFDDYYRSVNSLKIIKLLITTNFAFSKNGILQSMGSEFGNPDSFDFPRPNNNMDSSKLCCRWDLADNKNLRFKHIEFLNTFLVRIERILKWNNNNRVSNNINNRSRNNYEYYDITITGNEDGVDVANDRLEIESGNGKSSETVSLDNIVHDELDLILSSGNEYDNDTNNDVRGSNNVVYSREDMMNITYKKGGGLGSMIYNSLNNSSVKVLLCHESDKVLILERDLCTFVFNYSDKYYKNYGFGISSELPQSVLLDTQDERFGGNKKYVTSSYTLNTEKNNNSDSSYDYQHLQNRYEKNPDSFNLCGIHFTLDSISGFNIPSEYEYNDNNNGKNDSNNKILLSKNVISRELSAFEGSGRLLFGKEKPFDHSTNNSNFDPLSPYRYTNIQNLKQTIFLDMTPFSAYILAPFELVKKLPSEAVGNKLIFGESIDGFVDSIKYF
ncbi:hypothetical protein RS030_81183 [Cryptosporidium xiaoi]|uniref:Uncharacterized protein n=1 Tax=Cryptosporidium xiaoi TaxID=659607 RepID=A0AAV9XUM5_9CRYT